MQIDEITDDQIDLMLLIVSTTPLFSVATVPEDHKDYATKGEHHAKVRRNIEHLASLGFVEDRSNESGIHQMLNKRIEDETGYKYQVYRITELGIKAFQVLGDELYKELKYKNSIN